MKIILLLPLLLSLSCQAEKVNLVTGDFPPFVGGHLENGGLAAEIIQHIFTAMGHQPEIVFRPWKRGFSATMNGQFLGTFPYSKNSEREKILYFSNVMYELQEYFFTKQDFNLNYQSEKDLTGLRICKPIGYNLFGLKKLAEKNVIKLARPKSMGHCFKMLESDRVELVMTNEIAGWKFIEDLFENRNNFKMLEKSFVKIGHYFIIPKTNAEGEKIIKKFNEVLSSLASSGEIKAIQDKHIK
ncbi:substrate-binding periplasmic protein [Psychromonas aquimarina]|uniref:substrate-binding periplasmic protein n=1 Tax=Psychromonas aquimarina TaxID=444919 RepID=UPI000427FBAA|nr:transporter substrate-binding domain-containing protein [Psychromonas aquimarina]